jgi:hypothetical protein
MDHYFHFNQKNNEKDCASRCLYFILKLKLNIKETLLELKDQFKILDPDKNGLYLVDLYRFFSYFNIKYRVSIPTSSGLYMIFYNQGPKFGHFIIYKDGLLFDPVLSAPKQMTIEELQFKLESEFNGSVLCIRII